MADTISFSEYQVNELARKYRFKLSAKARGDLLAIATSKGTATVEAKLKARRMALDMKGD